MSDTENRKSDGHQHRSERIWAIIHDCIVRRAAGEVISDQSLLEAHPALMPELADKLRGLQLIESALSQVDDESLAARHGLRIRCPHCQKPIEVEE